MVAVLVTLAVLLVQYYSCTVEPHVALAVPDLPAFIMRGADCQGPLCCNKTVSEVFTSEQFDAFFPNRNSPTAHAQGFFTYVDFIRAAEMFSTKGFGLIGGEEVQKREIAAFFAHVAAQNTCGYTGAPFGGYYKYGLCYNEDPTRTSLYCEASCENPCIEGVSYHGRGAMLIYWNFNYNWIGKGLKVDLLHRPDLLQRNATLAFASSLYIWMTPRNGRPSPHSVMVGQWVPTLNDTRANRLPGFGATINILDHRECGTNSLQADQQDIKKFRPFLNLTISGFVSVILMQGPRKSALYRPNFDCYPRGDTGKVEKSGYVPSGLVTSEALRVFICSRRLRGTEDRGR